MSGAVDQIFISKWKINPESAKSYLYFWGFRETFRFFTRIVGFYEKSSALATFSPTRLKLFHVFRYDTSKTTEGKTCLPLIALK